MTARRPLELVPRGGKSTPLLAELIRDVAAALQPVAGRVPDAAIEVLEEAATHALAGCEDAARAALRRALAMPVGRS